MMRHGMFGPLTPKVVGCHMLVNAIRGYSRREDTFGSIIDEYIKPIRLRPDLQRRLCHSLPVREITRSEPLYF